MIAMPKDDCRAVIPAVERVARITRVTFKVLGGRLPVIDRDRGNDGREFESDLAPWLLLAMNIGPLRSVQFVFVRLTDLDLAPRPITAEVAALKAPVVRELLQMA